MPQALPAGAPTTMGAAFAHINSVTSPTLDDLKVMVLLEAAGLALYDGLAAETDNAAVVALLQHNGREELAHAHRVAKAIHALSGEAFPPPAAPDNPYLAAALPKMPVTADSLKGLAHGEFGGEALYESWAAAIGNEEAARQFRLNGKEEADHGQRLLEAAALLEG
jgi:rubrerythrin